MASLLKRGNTYYLQDRLSGRLKRWSLRTDSLQIAKEKLRQYESAQLRGLDNPLPTRTPIPEVLEAYVEHIRTMKTAKSAQTDVYYLREAFGPVCEGLRITSRNPSAKARKRPVKPDMDRRVKPHRIEAGCLEHITTADVQAFVDSHVRSRGLAPKTANRYREIICRLFNWAMQTGRIRMPGGINPASKVIRYKERAPQIRFLTMAQIDEQLNALRFKPQLHAMVAMLLYAGLRREELLWLTVEDVETRPHRSRPPMIRVQAKTIGGESWQPKTRVNRAVPVSTALQKVLANYTPHASDAGWFFPSPKGTRWDPDNFAADLRRANREAGLKWTCLDYRHTFGSQLAQRGVSLYKIATLLGNSPEICRRHYAALIPEAMAAEVEFLLCASGSTDLQTPRECSTGSSGRIGAASG